MVSQSVFCLRDRQRAVLKTILLPENSQREWKVLVCDSFTRSMLASLFSPSALRHHGITLNSLIHEARGPVPDVSALYIIAPTPDNIARISNDLSKEPVYRQAAVAFTSAISPSLLAAFAAQLPIPSPITRVHDVHSSYIALDQNLFTLNLQKSFLRIKSVSDESSMRAVIEPIVDGIFSVLFSLGVIPIIRSQRGGAAEAVSEALDQRIRDNLRLFQSSSISSRVLSFRRPLLLMLDRDFDFNSMLHHSWTYQALVHDCLNMKLNSVIVNVGEKGDASSAKPKEYCLDTQNDFFWKTNTSLPFPAVAERIETALAAYREDVEMINRKAGGSLDASQTSGGDSAGDMGTSRLAAAIASLPELSKRKETLDIHTNIATALLNNINKRALDTFFELEHQLISETSRPVTSLSADDYKLPLVELLKGVRETSSGDKRGEGTAFDRLRLFLIYYSVFGQQLSEKSMAEFRGILKSAGADISIIEYIGKLKGYKHDIVVSKTSSTQGTINAAKLKGLMTSVVNRGYRSIANVAQSAKKLIVEQKSSFPVTRALEIFMSEQARSRSEASTNDILDGYLLFDPKAMPSAESAIQRVSSRPLGSAETKETSYRNRMMRIVFSDVIVFTVGGGNYVEYDNCLETAASASTAASKKNVLYGTTELATSEDFVQQLAAVAQMCQEEDLKGK